MFGFWYFLSSFVCVHSLVQLAENKRSEDPGDEEEEALEPTVQIAGQQFFKMADGELQRRRPTYMHVKIVQWARV